MDTGLLYNGMKYLHILLAIVAVGFNASYAIWLNRAARDPQHLSHVLRGIKTLDDRFANPAYLLLLITGLTTAVIGGIPFTTFWIAAAIALWFVLVGVGVTVYTPTLRGMVATAEAGGADSPEYQRLNRRQIVVGIALAVIALVIVLLMVFKPARLL